jgi:hypothetical protein
MKNLRNFAPEFIPGRKTTSTLADPPDPISETVKGSTAEQHGTDACELKSFTGFVPGLVMEKACRIVCPSAS